MHASNIIQDLLAQECRGMHVKRQRCIAKLVEAGRRGGLGLLKMSRELCKRLALKHRIKCVDRFLGRRLKVGEAISIYQGIAKRCLPGWGSICIIIDWSDARRDGSLHLLRAAAIVKGRALIVYEEVHDVANLGSPAVHKQFLKNLRAVLPEQCRPILITDAGFRASWFKLASSLNYHWVGRIRNRDMVCKVGDSEWVGCKSLYKYATAKAQDLGTYEYARSNAVPCKLILLKKPPKGRKRLTVTGKVSQRATSKQNRAAQVEPWLLAVSPALDKLSAKTVVAIYSGRMQIEQTFRDLKNPKWGLGLSDSQTRDKDRLTAFLLLAALITYVLWIIGLAAAQAGYHVSYGSKKKAAQTLSTASLAQSWYADGFHPPFRWRQLREAGRMLASMVMRVKI